MISPPTGRELEVLAAYIRLGSTKAVAHELGISHGTVRNSLGSLRSRLGAGNTAQAFAICVKRGLLTKHGTPVT